MNEYKLLAGKLDQAWGAYVHDLLSEIRHSREMIRRTERLLELLEITDFGGVKRHPQSDVVIAAALLVREAIAVCHKVHAQIADKYPR